MLQYGCKSKIRKEKIRLTRENVSLAMSCEGGCLTAEMAGEIDHHTARFLREEIDRGLALELPRTLVLDRSGISFMDSSGIGLIVGRLERAREIGAALRLKGLSPRLERILELSGALRLPAISIEREDEKS